MAMPWRSPPESCATVEFRRDAGAAEADGVHQDVVGDLLLALDVDEAEAVGDLPSDEEIAPQRLFVGERFLLVDGLDGEVVRHSDRIVRQVDLAVADEDAPRGRRQHARHHLDQRRFSRAVVADQADDLVAADGQRDVAESPDRAKIFLDVLQPHDVTEVAARRALLDGQLLQAFPPLRPAKSFTSLGLSSRQKRKQSLPEVKRAAARRQDRQLAPSSRRSRLSPARLR